MNRSTARTIAAVVALIGACADLLGRPALPVRPGGKPADAPASPDLTRPLDDLVAAKKDGEFQISVQWFGQDGGRSLVVYGNGVSIWNQEKQFTLAAEQRLELLRLFQNAKFGSMPAQFGFANIPPGSGRPIRIAGTVSLTIGGVTKSVTQIAEGQQSAELVRLVDGIYQLTGKAAAKGVMAQSLADGLQKISKGELAPEVLALFVQRIENEGNGPNGWLLRLNGRAAELQVRSKAGMGKPYRFQLTPKQLDDLGRLLTVNEAEGLPVNLYAPDYTDFDVRVLKFNKNLQARKFANTTPQTHGEKQQNFDRIFAGLDRLRQQVLKEGKQDQPGEDR